MAELYYLQDSRDYVGNCMLFWAVDGGYTSDVSKAEVMTKEVAVSRNEDRESDIPWPKEYIDARTAPRVDHQYVNRKEALDRTGIKLKRQQRPPKPVFKCGSCGVFMSERDYYGSACKNCGCQDNGH